MHWGKLSPINSRRQKGTTWTEGRQVLPDTQMQVAGPKAIEIASRRITVSSLIKGHSAERS